MTDEFWCGFSWGVAISVGIMLAYQDMKNLGGKIVWPQDILALLFYFVMELPIVGCIVGMVAVLRLIVGMFV